MVLLYLILGDDLGIEVYFEWQAKNQSFFQLGSARQQQNIPHRYLIKDFKKDERPLNLMQLRVMTKCLLRFEQKILDTTSTLASRLICSAGCI